MSDKLSDLSAASSVAGADLLYLVQTVGSGGVKGTVSQLGTYLAGVLVGSFNGRTGTVTLSQSDVTTALGNYVVSFNTRTGAVTLSQSDVTTALGNYVVSAFSRTGTVTAQSGDYTAAQVTNAADTTAANTFTVSPQTIVADDDAHKGLVVRGHSATQSSNLQEWQKSDTTVWFAVSPGAGSFSLPSIVFGSTAVMYSGASGIYLESTVNSGSSTVLTVAGPSSGTGNLQDWRPTASAQVRAFVDVGGNVAFNSMSGSYFDAGNAGFPIVKTIVSNWSKNGSPSAGDGSRIFFSGDSSTTQQRAMAEYQAIWADPTDATRKARGVWGVYDTAFREACRIETDGSTARIGINGAIDVGCLWKVNGGALAGDIDTMTYAATISLDVTLGNVHKTTTVNATGNATINASAAGSAGQEITVLITGDATSSKTITFGTNFLSTGTIASVQSKTVAVRFASDGSNWIETGRQATGV